MEGQNQGRTVLAVTLLTAALLFATMRAVESAPFADWWLPILLFVAGIAVLLLDRFGWQPNEPPPDFDAEPEQAALPSQAVGAAHTYHVSAAAPLAAPSAAAPVVGTPSAPTAATAPINTMFIRPERAAEAVEAKPSPSMPLETAAAPLPAPPPPVPPEVETPPTDPVKEAVVEKTAAPQQPHEQASMGTLTPAEVERVVNDQPSETAAKVTKAAPPEIAAVETGASAAVSPDNLEMIDGIGPKLAAALRAAGIDSFQKLAAASESQLKEILVNASVRYPGTTLPTWAHQAAYAARQDWEGFKKYNADRKISGGGGE